MQFTLTLFTKKKTYHDLIQTLESKSYKRRDKYSIQSKIKTEKYYIKSFNFN